MQLDRSDNEKLYIRLTEIFLMNIRSGEWRTGQQIPTEEDLCRGFNVSKITVRRAINNLVIEGYLEKLQGKGTFVRPGPPRSGIAMKTTLLESIFQPDDGQYIRLIEKKTVTEIDAEAMRRMGPAVDRDIFYVSRLKLAEGVPVLVNEVFVPVRICPAIRDWDPEGGAVFEFLKEHQAPRIVRVSQSVEVGKPGRMAELLSVRPASHCMIIHRVFLGAGELTVAYSRTTARGDRFRLDSEYQRLS